MRTIAQRDLRNHIRRVLREVEAGESMQVTVDGRPVAELTPIAGIRRKFVARETIAELLRQAPLDVEFARDVDELIDATTDEL